MPFIPLQPPAGMDTDGLRKHGEDQFREVARAWTEVEKSVVDGDAVNTAAIATNTANIATNTAAIATNTAAIAAHESAWTAYTPTLTAFAGTYTSASAAGRYKTIGKTVFLHVTINITTVGTGTFPLITLPVVPLDYNHAYLYGTERALTEFMVVGRRNGAASTILVAYVNNTHLSANGAVYELTGTYEAA